ncbi:hypothetical protein PtB15_15B296 [Puccinia triticina]|nr:hypothetical protein PtB15_15B296 [Puccinia triticina]
MEKDYQRHLLGNNTIYLEKAVDLGTRLLPIFDLPTGIPYSFINLKTGEAKADKDNQGYTHKLKQVILRGFLKELVAWYQIIHINVVDYCNLFEFN